MVARVKNYKAGFVISDSNLRRTAYPGGCAGPESSAPATPPWPSPMTAPATGKLLGLVTSRDYRVSRMDPDCQGDGVHDPVGKAHLPHREGTTLKEANDIIWDHKLNALPIVDEDGHLVSFVFRKDYDSHKEQPPGAAGQPEALCGGRGHQHP